MPFRPINNDHAIEAVGFSLDMDRYFSRKELMAIRDGHPHWYDRLPGFQYKENPSPGVVYFAFLQPDGTSSWSMTVSENRISVVCKQYTRWVSVWSQALKILRAVSEVIVDDSNDNDSPLNILSIILEVDDVFISDDPGKTELKELFATETKRVLGSVFNPGHNWHQDTGGFITWSQDLNCLEQIVLKGSVIDRPPSADDGDPENLSIVQVKHALSLRSIDSMKYPLSVDLFSDKGLISQEMSKMHKLNKAFLRDLLIEEMRTTIRLDIGEI